MSDLKEIGKVKLSKVGVVPRLRFPEFRDAREWVVKPLGKLCEVMNNSRKPISSNIREKGTYPYYGASGIVDYVQGFIFEERLLLVGEDGAKWGAFEKTAFIVEGKYWVNNHAHVLRATEINDTLLENYLVKLDITPFITGAAPPKLTLRKLKEILIPLSLNLREQQKIADCLSSIDELIAAQSQKIEALKTHKKGLMQQLFPAEGETLPKLRFPEFRNTGGWVVKPLGKLCEVLNNRRKPISSDVREKGIYPYYGASGIVDYVSNFIFEERLVLIGEDGAKWGAFEKTAFIVEGKYWVNNHAHVLKTTEINDTLLESYLIKLDINPFITGAAPPKLTLGKLKEIPIPLPLEPKEQQKIADCLSSLDELINAQTQKLEKLKQHKKGLMQQLFPSIDELAG